jgi:GNAT superfamily N-acetyltransferase
MIRPAVRDDLPQLVELGRVMHAEARRLNKLTYVPAKVYANIANLIGAEHGFVWVAEEDSQIVGGLVAYLDSPYYSTDRMAFDMALFIRPEKRGGMTAARLVKEYMAWAKRKNAVITQFGIGTGVHLGSTSALLERVGFKPSGFLFDVE